MLTCHQLALPELGFFNITNYNMRYRILTNKSFPKFHVIHSIDIDLFFIGIGIDYQRIVSGQISPVFIKKRFFMTFHLK